MPTKPEPLNLGVPVVNFPRANAILARAQALLWVRDWAKGSFLLAKYYVIQARESKTRYLEKFKINISSRRIHTKLSTRKRLNTKSILHI